MTRPPVRAFTDDDVAAAGRLLAARHGAARRRFPPLDPAFTDPAVAADAVAASWDRPGCTGAVSGPDGHLTGYLLGAPDPRGDVWGPNVWVDAAGFAAMPDVVADLYALAAQRWVDDGAVAHYVVLPADDALVAAWFDLGFGGQQVHAVHEGPVPEPRPPHGVRLRPAQRGDVPRLAHLDLVLPAHHRRAPVFSAGPPVSFDEALAEWEESIDDPAYTTVVAEVDGDVVGSAVGCDLTLSSTHVGVARVPDAGFLGFVAVDPPAQGRGIGTALGAAVVAWSYRSGHPVCVTDWRATNPPAARAWTALGFVPTFLRVHRHLGF